MMFKYFLLFLVIASSYIFPQEVKYTDFKLALDYYNAYQYENALTEFTRISEDQNNPNYTAAIFFKGKILFMLNRFDQAVNAYSFLYKNYTDSKYIDEARIVSAKYYLIAKKYSKAFNELSLLIKNTSSQEYLNAAKITGKKISSLYLSEKEIDSALTIYKKSKVEPFLLLCYAIQEYQNGDMHKADSLFQLISRIYYDSDESKEALSFRKGSTSQENVIAALLPLTSKGRQDESAEEILEGIKFAVDEFNQTAFYKAGLLIKNTERDSAKVKELKKSLLAQRNIKAVIGPVYSDEVRYMLETFKDMNIPIMSPTATDNELTKKYPLFIQANTSFGYRGSIMAQYIYFVEGKRKIAVLSPSTGYASQISAAFKSEFKRLGGKITADEIYKTKNYELTKQAASIAAKIKEIEGIFVPLSDKSDAPVILSQLESNQIDVNLYGNQDWFYAKGFQSSTNLSNKLIFSSDYFIDYNDPGYVEFSSRFKEKTGIEPGRNVLYGYDAAKCLLSATNGTTTRENILEKLNSGLVYDGYHNNLCFDSNRMNSVTNIVRYRDGVFELIERFKAGK